MEATGQGFGIVPREGRIKWKSTLDMIWKLGDCRDAWEFLKIRGTTIGFHIIRTIVFRGLYWGPFILGNYHICVYRKGLQGGFCGRV